MVEAVVAITLIGIGVASTLGVLSRCNALAATSRNATGASAILMNQIDLFQTMSPFIPAKSQIPVDTANGTYDMTVGTHTINFVDPTSGVRSNQTDPWPVYREPSRWTYVSAVARTSATGFTPSDVGQLAYESDNQTYWRLDSIDPTWTRDLDGGTIVRGTLTCTVTDVSTATMPNTYKAVYTIGYQYLGRGPTLNAGRNRKEYQMSMTAIRTSDI